MGEHIDEQPESGLPGVTTATDVGGLTGTQADANEDNKPNDGSDAQPEPAQIEDVPQNLEWKLPEGLNPGQAVGADAPTLESLQNKLCPNCHTGVLYVTNYDPGARHEEGQGDALESGKGSGGGYEVQCQRCTFSASYALNPGKRWGR